MATLEDLKPGVSVRGAFGDGAVTVVEVTWHGTNAVELIYKDDKGRVDNQLLFRDHEPKLEMVTEGKPWSFDADGHLLRLVSEAQRIRWAHLFDPYVAVNTSLVEPLPHQITAVYGEMLSRQPLHYMLADDPGAGKTIMTGLYIKELIIRGDLERCLIVVPGNLVEQWQDELYQKFNLPFDILTRDLAASARTGNIFNERDLLVARLDQLARGEDFRAQLQETDWDLIVVDEAHKMSATYFGGEVKYTQRYRLGEEISRLTRNFLLLTATPHNGKERDFQLFMSLLDADRFEGIYRPGVHKSDVSDLMRRMVKEKLVRFDGTPLFPERRAYTVTYQLSDDEALLYEEVTEYVREEFNRADQLLEGGRRGTVGFALTILQRRLASSSEAIYHSLRRRRERLEQRLHEASLEHRVSWLSTPMGEEEIEDLEDAPAEELEVREEELLDEATTARTVRELELEIQRLRELEALAQRVRQKGQDRKWEELSRLLQEQQEMFTTDGRRRKIVIFTEHVDTLKYLADQIRTLLGRPEAVVTIYGGMRREERRHVQEAFTNDKEVQVLVATDAAGEGINLQRAHLMVNYDLPWNPNRIEQRFGRIHRIGQTEVCHLWNLVAEETREGDVYQTLLRKLEQERTTLGGAVFDVLGKAIQGTELRRLLIEAVRYGDRPDVRAQLSKKIEGALDHRRLEALMEEEALAHDVLSAQRVSEIQEDMQRAQARRLQPHYIASFFREAFERLGGTLYEREPGRYEITHVPARVRNRSRRTGGQGRVVRRYERICFDRDHIHAEEGPAATFVAPGHPLLSAVIDLTLEAHRPIMKQGAVLIDDSDPGEELRALIYLEHAVEDGRETSSGKPLTASRRFQFAEIELADTEEPRIRAAGPAPYLNYRPPADDERRLIDGEIGEVGLDLEDVAVSFAIQHIVPEHLAEVRRVREPRIRKARAAVKERLTKEIAYWDHRAEELKAAEEAGKTNARLNADKARQRADGLETRLARRMEELTREGQLSARPPAVLGGALIVPAGYLQRLRGERADTPSRFARETVRVERAAMEAVMHAERRLGHTPRDVGAQNLGYDVESRPANEEAHLRFIEVKGRIEEADTVTITRNEILTALNRPEDWVLALVRVPAEASGGSLPEEEGSDYGNEDRPAAADRVHYVRRPPFREPGFAETSVNFKWQELWELGRPPTC